MSITQSKSNLAKLLSQEDILVEQRKTESAYFDLKNRTLVIPTLKEELSSDLQDLFISHEVSHALHTPTEGWFEALDLGLKRSIVNICEDSRIERLIKNKYPGLKSIYSRAYKELQNKDFFGLSKLNTDKINLADKINLHCKVGFLEFIEFNEREQEILEKVENTSTWNDVVEVSKELQEYIKDQYQKQSLNDADYEYSSIDKMSIEEIDVGRSETEKSDVKSESKSESSSSSDDSGLESGYDELGDFGDEKDYSIDDSLESFTDKYSSDNIKTLYSESNRDSIYVNIPEVNTKEYIIPYKKIYSRLEKDVPFLFDKDQDKFIKFKSENASIVSYLVKEFTLKKNAQGRKKAKISKTGDINLNKIYSYKFNSDIFKRNTKVPGEKNHSMVFFLDWSASMDSYMNDTIKQLLCLVMFCRKMNIPYEVYAFTTSCGDLSNHKQTDQRTERSAILNVFDLMNILSYKMSNREFINAANVLLSYNYSYFTVNSPKQPYWEYSVPSWFRLGNTPLDHTLAISQRIAKEFKSETKTDIINVISLSDGESHPMAFFKDGYKYHTNYHGFNVHLRDERNKTSQLVKKDDGMISGTNACIKLIKQSCDYRYFGFRLISQRNFKSLERSLFGKYYIEDEFGEFKKNNAVKVTNTAFDEFWVVKTNVLATTEEDFSFSEKETVATATKKFMKSMNNKINNRVFLNKFISFIS